MFQLTTPAVIVFFAAVVQISFAGMLMTHKKKRGARELSLVMITLFLYSLGTGIEHIALNPVFREFGVHIQYLGMPYLPLVLFRFITSYYQLRLKHEKLYSLLFLFAGFVFMLLQFTYPYHHLFYSDKSYAIVNGFSALTMKAYPMYYLHNLLHLAGAFVYIYFSLYMMVRGRRAYFKRGIILILTVFIPLMVNIFTMGGGKEYSIDYLPYSMLISTGMFIYLFLTDSLFGPVPVENRYVIESLTDGIIVFDDNEVILEFNKKAAEFIPGLEEKHIGMSLIDVSGDVENLSRFVLYAASDDEGYGHEVDVLLPDGNLAYYEVRRCVVEHESRDSFVSTLIIQDVSERRHMVHELQRSYEKIVESDRLKGLVIDVMSHNLRIPMQMMKSLRQLIGSEEAVKSPAIWKRGGQELDNLIDRADSLIGNLLTLNISLDDESAYPLGVVDLDSVLRDISPSMKRYAQKKRISLLPVEEAGVLVHAHEKLLHITLRNILENAVKFTWEEGEINVRVVVGAEIVKVIVEDTGVTISRDILTAFEQGRWGLVKLGTSGEGGCRCRTVCLPPFHAASKRFDGHSAAR